MKKGLRIKYKNPVILVHIMKKPDMGFSDIIGEIGGVKDFV